jgi:hypothetical protein
MSWPCGSEAGQNRDGAAITPERTTGSGARAPESIDWEMRFAAKLTGGQAEARTVLSAGNRTVSAARANQAAQPMPCHSRLGNLGETPCAGRSGIKPGRIQLRPQKKHLLESIRYKTALRTALQIAPLLHAARVLRVGKHEERDRGGLELDISFTKRLAVHIWQRAICVGFQFPAVQKNGFAE